MSRGAAWRGLRSVLSCDVAFSCYGASDLLAKPNAQVVEGKAARLYRAVGLTSSKPELHTSGGIGLYTYGIEFRAPRECDGKGRGGGNETELRSIIASTDKP